MAKALSPAALKKLAQLRQDYARTYGVDDVTRSFAIEPSIAQKLDKQITDQSDFLQKISMVPVDTMSGDIVLLGINKPIASRSNIKAGKERKAKWVGNLDDRGYQCVEVDSDTAIPFDTIDSWAKFGQDVFRNMYSDFVQERIALDRIMAGWHGTHAAAETDPTTYPLLEDVAPGWLQYIRNNDSSRLMTGGKTDGKIVIGAGGDYNNLSALVYDLKSGIHLRFRGDDDLVCIVGDDLLNREGLKLHQENGQKPSEKVLLTTAEVVQMFGGLPPELCPFFHERGCVVTSLKNLAIYVQESSWRRFQKDNPKGNSYDDFISRNEGYVVQEPLKFAAIEPANLKFVGEPDTPQEP